MAITFRGMARTHIVLGNDATTQNLFTIENGYASRVDLYIRMINVSIDDIGLLTVVTPLIKLSRATGISGGQIVEKTGFDTTQSSDANVIFRAPLLEMARITATPGDTIWEKYDNRLHTAAEQQRPDVGKNLLPSPAVRKTNFVVRPGQALLVQVVSAAATSNAAIANNYFVECQYDENPISTFSISGTVTLNSVGQAGAKVMVLEADDVDLTNAFLREVITTPAGGAWSSTIRTGKVGAAFVQYRDGSTYYTAPGSPFLS